MDVINNFIITNISCQADKLSKTGSEALNIKGWTLFNRSEDLKATLHVGAESLDLGSQTCMGLRSRTRPEDR